jgi:hypothetical protein
MTASWHNASQQYLSGNLCPECRKFAHFFSILVQRSTISSLDMVKSTKIRHFGRHTQSILDKRDGAPAAKFCLLTSLRVDDFIRRLEKYAIFSMAFRTGGRRL